VDSPAGSLPFADSGNVDGGLEADGELVEAGGHRPVALEPVDAAFDRVAGLVVLAVECRRAPAVAATAPAMAGLVGRLRDGGPDPTAA
jgi:hypothetical protein